MNEPLISHFLLIYTYACLIDKTGIVNSQANTGRVRHVLTDIIHTANRHIQLTAENQKANANDFLYLIHDLLFLPISTIESGVS